MMAEMNRELLQNFVSKLVWDRNTSIGAKGLWKWGSESNVCR